MKAAMKFALLAAFLAPGLCAAQTLVPVDATLTKVKGAVLVNQGEMFVDAIDGTNLKANDRVMAMEGASAYIRFFEGCELRVPSGEVVVVPDDLNCECQNFRRENGTIARVDEMSGESMVKIDGTFKLIGLGSDLVRGDVLRTGPDSSAVIQFRDGCRREIEASTEYTIPDTSPCSCPLVPLAGNAVAMSGQTLARIFIPPILIIPFIWDDDGPISP